MRILHYGSLNPDFVYRAKALARPGETVRAEDFQIFSGGKGLNQSVAMAKAGLRVCHAGCVGEDGGRRQNPCLTRGKGFCILS